MGHCGEEPVETSKGPISKGWDSPSGAGRLSIRHSKTPSSVYPPRDRGCQEDLVGRFDLLDFDRGVDPLNWSAVSADEHS